MLINYMIRKVLNSKFLFLSLHCSQNCLLPFGITLSALRLQFTLMLCIRFVNDLHILKILILCSRVAWKFFASYLNVAI